MKAGQAQACDHARVTTAAYYYYGNDKVEQCTCGEVFYTPAGGDRVPLHDAEPDKCRLKFANNVIWSTDVAAPGAEQTKAVQPQYQIDALKLPTSDEVNLQVEVDRLREERVSVAGLYRTIANLQDENDRLRRLLRAEREPVVPPRPLRRWLP